MQRMGTYACDPRMHYQEWNFIKFARSVRRERFRKKKQGGEKKRKKEKKCDRLQLPPRIAGINSHTWRGRGRGYYTGGHIVKTVHIQREMYRENVEHPARPPPFVLHGRHIAAIFRACMEYIESHYTMRPPPPFRPTADPFSRSFVFNGAKR